MLSRIGGALFSTKQRPQHAKRAPAALPASRCVRPASWRNSAAASCHRKGTPKVGAARPRRRGACCLMVLPDPGSAAGAPAVLGWSRPSMAPTLLVRRQLLVVILMLHPGRRRPRLASGALVQNKLHVLRPAQQSRPVPPTDRNRCAFPHGKASPGRGASLLPAWSTAVRPWARSGRVPAPAPRQDGLPVASPGAGLVGPTQLAGPGSVAVLIQCVQSLESGSREK